MAGFARALSALGGFVLAVTAVSVAVAGELTSHGARKPSVAWAMSVGEIDKQVDEIDGIAVDNAGNAILSGIFKNKLTIGSETYTSRGRGDLFLTSIAANGKINWSHHFGGSGDDNTFDLTTDSAGNIYMSGWFAAKVDFGGQTMTSKGGQDAFVAKYASNGKLIWVRAFGGSDSEGSNEISVLDNGEIAVSVLTNGTFQAEGKSYRFGGGGRDSFLIRLSPAGRIRTVTHVNGTGFERIRAVSMAPSGDIYLGFTFKGQLALQGKTLTSRGDWDGAAARLDKNGNVVWLSQVGSSKGEDNVRGIAVAPDGKIYASGAISGAGILFDRKIGALGGKRDDFVVRLSPEGKVLVALTISGPGHSIGPELQADSRGVIASALIDGKVTIRRDGKVIATVSSPSGPPTSYAAAFDPGGNLRFIYSPSPIGRRSGAFGDTLAISRNGKYLVQSLRYRGQLSIAGTRMSTPAKMDSAVIFMNLNGS